MKHFFLSIITLLLCIVSKSYGQPKANDREWLNSMRTEHPRMFLTSEDIPQIQQTAATYGAATFNTFKKRIDKLIGKEIVFENELAKTGESTKTTTTDIVLPRQRCYGLSHTSRNISILQNRWCVELPITTDCV